MHDFEAAKKKAAAEKKDLLVDATGSDWCHWCIKLNEEVFSKDAFKKGVADKYVLVELDYPRDKSKLSDETIAQNEKLMETYQFQGFPTIMLMDAEGRPYAKTGYQKGGAESYVAHLDELQEKKAVRDAALEKAGKLEGVEKAKALVGVLEVIPEGQAASYGNLAEQITANDPEDVTGFGAKLKREQAEQKLEEVIGAAMQAGKTGEALAAIDAHISEFKIEGVEKQQSLSIKFNILMQGKDFDAAGKVLDEVIAIDPESPMGKGAAGFKPRFEKMKAEAAAAASPEVEEKVGE